MVDPLLEERRRNPRDDLISLLVQAEVDGNRLDDEAIRTFVRHLFPAGADTTYLGLGNVLSALLQDPELLDLARREPERRRAMTRQHLLDVFQFDFDFAVFPEGLIRRIENDNAVCSIQQDMLAGIQALRDVFQAYDRRDTQRTRHDGGMRSPASDVRGESENQLAI